MWWQIVVWTYPDPVMVKKLLSQSLCYSVRMDSIFSGKKQTAVLFPSVCAAALELD